MMLVCSHISDLAQLSWPSCRNTLGDEYDAHVQHWKKDGDMHVRHVLIMLTLLAGEMVVAPKKYFGDVAAMTIVLFCPRGRG